MSPRASVVRGRVSPPALSLANGAEARAGSRPDHDQPSLTLAKSNQIDPLAAEAAIADLLAALGQDPDDPQLRDTPRRVAAALAEMLSPAAFSLTTFLNDDHYDELVVVRDIPLHSLCAHHMLPFVGVAHLGYLPGERILGLSSWPGSSSCSPGNCRSRSGSRSRSATGSSSTCSRRGWVWSSKPSTSA